MRTRPPGRRQQGLALIELLVVLTILAMVATFAAPSLSRQVGALGFDRAVSELKDTLKRARMEAMRRQRETWVEIDVANAGYRAGGESTNLPDGLSASLLTARRELVSDGVGRIRFFPDGASTGGAIILRDGGRAKEIRVDWFDGGVAVAHAAP